GRGGGGSGRGRRCGRGGAGAHQRGDLLDRLRGDAGLREVGGRRVRPAGDDLLRRRRADAGQRLELLLRRVVQIDLAPGSGGSGLRGRRGGRGRLRGRSRSGRGGAGGHQRGDLLDRLRGDAGLREIGGRRIGAAGDDLLRGRRADAGQPFEVLLARGVEVDLGAGRSGGGGGLR